MRLTEAETAAQQQVLSMGAQALKAEADANQVRSEAQARLQQMEQEKAALAADAHRHQLSLDERSNQIDMLVNQLRQSDQMFQAVMSLCHGMEYLPQRLPWRSINFSMAQDND